MKKIGIFLTILAFIAISGFSQTRDDIHIYIPPVQAADPNQAAFFAENFEIETTGAGYSLAGTPSTADYTLRLEVKPNMILYEDGYEEPAPPNEPQFVLYVHLIRSEDNMEIVAFSFPFTELEEMYNFNLSLVYQAMANVPLTKMTSTEWLDNRWRNKWLYFRASFDYPVAFYEVTNHISGSVLVWDSSIGNFIPMPVNHTISPFPAATVGMELQYLNWMSTDVSFNLSFSDPLGNTFIPAIQIEQKFIIKPNSPNARHYMIEPYAIAAFPLNTSTNSIDFPWLGVGGGLQLGMKGGEMGAFFFDINFVYYLGNVVTPTPYPENTEHPNNPKTLIHNRYVLGLSLGYKVGIYDRAWK